MTVRLLRDTIVANINQFLQEKAHSTHLATSRRQEKCSSNNNQQCLQEKKIKL